MGEGDIIDRAINETATLRRRAASGSAGEGRQPTAMLLRKGKGQEKGREKARKGKRNPSDQNSKPENRTTFTTTPELLGRHSLLSPR